MSEPTATRRGLTSAQVRALAAAAGVDLDEGRAATLVPQAAQHFALLRELDAVDPQDAEPAGEFRLDAWRRFGDA